MGKLSNQRLRLQRLQRTHKEADIQRSINQVAEILTTLEQLPVQQASARRVLGSGEQGMEGTVLGTILGLEGAGSAASFRCFQAFLTNPQQWPFPGRVKRPATDPVNALLSFGSALLTRKVAHAVQLVGFDHSIGSLHRTVAGRPALALDLMEEFRPLSVGSVVVELLNHRVLVPTDVVEKVGASQLKPEKRAIFFTKCEERLNGEIQHPLFGYRTTYRRCLELQARLLAKTVTGEIDTSPSFLVR
jgi:CRISP-associated protein Cas1